MLREIAENNNYCQERIQYLCHILTFYDRSLYLEIEMMTDTEKKYEKALYDSINNAGLIDYAKSSIILIALYNILKT